MFLWDKPQPSPRSPAHSLMSPVRSLKVPTQRLLDQKSPERKGSPSVSTYQGPRPSFLCSVLPVTPAKAVDLGDSQHLLSLAMGSVSLPQSSVGVYPPTMNSVLSRLAAPSAFAVLASPPLGSRGSHWTGEGGLRLPCRPPRPAGFPVWEGEQDVAVGAGRAMRGDGRRRSSARDRRVTG